VNLFTDFKVIFLSLFFFFKTLEPRVE